MTARGAPLRLPEEECPAAEGVVIRGESVTPAELVHVLARKSDRDEAFVTQALQQFLAFVAMAEDLGARWITADERAAKITGKELSLALRDR